MAKKEGLQETFEIDKPLTHLAISIANIKGTWGLVEVGYNEAGDAGEFKYTPCGGDRQEAIEAFKVKAANTFMK